MQCKNGVECGNLVSTTSHFWECTPENRQYFCKHKDEEKKQSTKKKPVEKPAKIDDTIDK